VSTGATGLLVAALVERRTTAGPDGLDDLRRDLGTFLVASVEANGAVSKSYDTTAGRFDRGSYSPFFTGEIYWALALLDTVLPGEGFGDAAARIERYLVGERYEAEDWFPPLADHWAAYGLATVHGTTLAGARAGFVDRQLDLFGPQVRWESQRGEGWWTYLTRGRRTLGAGLGTLGEGLTNLWTVASPEDRAEIAERSECVAGMLVDRQAGGDDPAERGAWFQFDITQMDDQQHALSALLLTRELRTRDDPGLDDPGLDDPGLDDREETR